MFGGRSRDPGEGLGTVVHGQRDREMMTKTDGSESVQIDIYKEADANMIEVAAKVTELVGTSSGSSRSTLAGKLRAEEDAYLSMVADRSIFIDNSISEVIWTAYIGGMLAILILLLFLRDLRTTVIIALSIPISIFITFAPLNILNVTLNIMSLGGLAMGIGMLVDSSIVVLESIYRCREEGDSIRSAAIRGTKEVRGAVIASTLTSICVFFPMVFVEGLAGQVFSDLGLTVVTSLIASLIVAVLFIPMLASRTGFQLKSDAGMVSHFFGSINGRMNLSSYWLRFLFPAAVLLVAMQVVVLSYTWWMVGAMDDPEFEEGVVYGAVAMSVFSFWQLVCFIPGIIALAKRLHDLGRTAWWLLAAAAPPFVAMIAFVVAAIALSENFKPETFALFGVSWLLVLVSWAPAGLLTLICSVVPGSKNENRFGQADHEGQTLAKLWGSFRAFGESHQRKWGFLDAPLLCVRGHLVPDGMIGLSLVWVIRAVPLSPL